METVGPVKPRVKRPFTPGCAYRDLRRILYFLLLLVRHLLLEAMHLFLVANIVPGSFLLLVLDDVTVFVLEPPSLEISDMI